MFTSTIARRLVGSIGALSLGAVGFATVAAGAASASTVPACTSQQLSTSLSNPNGPFGSNAQSLIYHIIVTNNGAKCTLAAKHPGVYTPVFTNYPNNNVAHAGNIGWTPYKVTLAHKGRAEAILNIQLVGSSSVYVPCSHHPYVPAHYVTVSGPSQVLSKLFITLPDSNGGVK